MLLLTRAASSGDVLPQRVTLVDVLVLYTPQARDGAGGTTALLKQINVALMEANNSFQRSRVNVRVRVPLAVRINYLESGSVATDLERLRNSSDGFMDSVQTLRDRYAADLVCLVTETGDDWYFYGLQGPSAANAFSIIRRPFLTGNAFLPVALGFNFGCQLERGYADSAGAFPYAYGYSFSASGTLFSTVDAFSGQRLPFFSNPEIFYEGIPAGVPVGMAGAANNALVLNQTGPIVGAFRGRLTQTFPPIVDLAMPAQGTTLRAGEQVRMAANVSDADGRVRRVDFYDGTNWLGSVGSRPFVALWRNVPAGRHSLIATATDDSGATTVSDVRQLSILPNNDHFTNRTRIIGSRFATQVDNVLATAELDEPAHEFWPAHHSLWWTWTAPANGVLWLDTVGSEVDTALSVYAGSTLAELTPAASTYSFVAEPRRLRFKVEAGNSYQIAVDGLYFAAGKIALNLNYTPSPPNDAFATRALIKGNRARITASVVGASIEPDEPNFAETSLWWSWVAPAAGGVKLRLAPTADALGYWISLFSGDVMSELSYLGGGYANADHIYQVQAGERLQLAVGTQGAPDYPCTNCLFTLDLTFSPVAANDHFTNRTRLVGSHIMLTNSLLGTTVEEGEPNRFFYGTSIWWSWTAPTSGWLELSSASGHILEVYSGDTLFNLAVLTFGPGLQVTAGTIYVIKATGDPTDVALELTFTRAPINDDFERRTRIAGSKVTLESSLLGATIQEGELDSSIGNSIWWSWTAPASGLVTLYSDADAIHVFTGDQFINLTVIEIGYGSVSFQATAGTTYALKVSGAPHDIMLDLLLSTVRIASPTDGARFALGKSVPVRVSTTANDGARQVDLFLNGQAAGSFTRMPYAVIWTNVPLGDNILTATATDQRGRQRSSPPVTFHITPSNDDFTNRMVISGTWISLTNSAVAATFEINEPHHGGAYWERSLWWSWTAPVSGYVELEFPNEQFFGVYRGSFLTNLTEVVSGRSIGAFDVVEGGTYAIAALGWKDEVQMKLNLSTVRIKTPTNGTHFTVGSDIHIEAENTAAHTLMRKMEFFANDLLLGITTNQPFSLVWSNAPPGVYNLTLTGLDEQEIQRHSPPVTIFIPPVNDSFYNATPLLGDVSVQGSTVGATEENGEPGANDPFGGTVWYTWTATRSEVVAIGISGSASPYATVYLGNSLPNRFVIELPTLYAIASTSASQPGARFAVTAGTVYRIAVTHPFYGDSFTLTIRQLPTNDNFAQRIAITNVLKPVEGNNLGATAEVGECLNCQRQSVWWTWTAPRSGLLTLTRSYTEGFPLLQIYTGSNVMNLEQVPLFAYSAGDHFVYEVSEGISYHIAADRKWNSDWSVIFTLGFIPKPENDNFADRTLVTGTNLVLQADNRQGTSEPGEPNHFGPPARSLWYSWTAPADGVFTIDNGGVFVAVYAGDTFSSLVRIAQTNGLYRVTAGAMCAIAIDGPPTDFTVNLRFTPSPANDHFANRLAMTGMAVSHSGTTGFATLETGEPAWTPPTPDRSVWFDWVAPADSFARVHCPQGLLRVFNGESLTNLILIAGPLTNELSFDAVAGQHYQIEVAGWSSSPDDYELSVALAKVAIVSPTNGAAFPPSADIPIFTSTIDLEGEVRTVGFFAGTNSLGVATNRPFTIVWRNAPVGLHQLTAVALDEFEHVTQSKPVEIRVPAPNDNFANRVFLTGATATFSVTNAGATREPDEFLPGGATGKTLWWSWTAPSDGTVSITTSAFATGVAMNPSTVKSNSSSSIALNSVIIIIIKPPPPIPPLPPGTFTGPLIAVYTGATLPSLSLCASNTVRYWDGRWNYMGQFGFPVVSGQTYHISLDGINGSSGAATFNFTFTPPPLPPPPPANDHFTNRFTLLGSAISTNATTIQASRESLEPGHGLDDNAQTVWWSWTAPSSGDVSVDAGYSKNIAVYTGNALAELTPVAVNYYLARFYAHAGTTYQIVVASSSGDASTFTLSLNGQPPPPAIDELNSGRLPNGFHHIRVTGVRGQSFVLQASSGNLNWQTLLIETLQGDYMDVFDNQAARFPNRVYRVLPLAALFDAPQPLQVAGAAVSLQPVRISSFGMTDDGRFWVRVTGTAGQSFRLQSSIDLQNWSDSTNSVTVEGGTDFTDASIPNREHRFYRILIP